MLITSQVKSYSRRL